MACSVEGAGRTDAGVSALAQVAAFDLPDGTDLYRLRASLNGLTARDISVVDLTEVPASFDPRRDAVSRTYRYTVVCGRPPSPMLADRSWHVYPDLDESLLQELADMVVGTHDFAAFRSADCDSSSTERQILSSRWRRDGHVLVYEVSGNAFLKQMVRVLVGSMVDVALGDLEKNDFAALFDHGDRRRAGRTAPAKGLMLVGVVY